MGLNSKIKCKTTLRGVYFIPNVLAVLVVGYIFNYLFSNSLPALGEKLGIDFLATSLLTKASTAWIGIVILAVWQAAAFNIIIYIAGLQTVPQEVYEAAAIDGASPWRQFRSITFPMIAGFFTINMVLSLKSFLQVFDHIVVAHRTADRARTPSQWRCSSTRAASKAVSTATRARTRWSSSSSSLPSRSSSYGSSSVGRWKSDDRFSQGSRHSRSAHDRHAAVAVRRTPTRSTGG